MLYLLTLGVLAGSVTAQSPVPSNLIYAGVPIPVPNVLLAELAFPGHGVYVQMLLLVYMLMLARHALTCTMRWFVRSSSRATAGARPSASVKKRSGRCMPARRSRVSRRRQP